MEPSKPDGKTRNNQALRAAGDKVAPGQTGNANLQSFEILDKSSATAEQWNNAYQQLFDYE